MEKDLNKLVEKLKQAAGENLKSVVLYGSAASGQFQEKHSDVNVLCTLAQREASALDVLSAPAAWWSKKGQPPLQIFTMEELRRSADVFAIELLDIKAHHRVLYGEDCFQGLEVPMDLHRVQLEHELRTKSLLLRQGYIAAAGDKKALLRLMTDSVTSFLTLFRHALIAFGEEAPPQRHEVLERIGQRLGVDVAAFHAVLDIREGKRKSGDLDVCNVARSYVDHVARLVDEVDRTLAR